jgi:hypothetical protein
MSIPASLENFARSGAAGALPPGLRTLNAGSLTIGKIRNDAGNTGFELAAPNV